MTKSHLPHPGCGSSEQRQVLRNSAAHPHPKLRRVLLVLHSAYFPQCWILVAFAIGGLLYYTQSGGAPVWFSWTSTALRFIQSLYKFSHKITGSAGLETTLCIFPARQNNVVLRVLFYRSREHLKKYDASTMKRFLDFVTSPQQAETSRCLWIVMTSVRFG